MAAVARRLGVTPMALYRHVADKEHLLDGVVESLLLEIAGRAAVQNDDTLEVALRRFVDAAERTAAAHPEAFALLLGRPARTEGSEAIRDQVYVLLRASGIPERHVRDAERHVTTTVLGIAAGHASRRFPAAPLGGAELTVKFVLAGVASLMTDGEDQA